jgi:hypothetical protein
MKSSWKHIEILDSTDSFSEKVRDRVYLRRLGMPGSLGKL